MSFLFIIFAKFSIRVCMSWSSELQTIETNLSRWEIDVLGYGVALGIDGKGKKWGSEND